MSRSQNLFGPELHGRIFPDEDYQTGKRYMDITGEDNGFASQQDKIYNLQKTLPRSGRMCHKNKFLQLHN